MMMTLDQSSVSGGDSSGSSGGGGARGRANNRAPHPTTQQSQQQRSEQWWQTPQLTQQQPTHNHCNYDQLYSHTHMSSSQRTYWSGYQHLSQQQPHQQQGGGRWAWSPWGQHQQSQAQAWPLPPSFETSQQQISSLQAQQPPPPPPIPPQPNLAEWPPQPKQMLQPPLLPKLPPKEAQQLPSPPTKEAQQRREGRQQPAASPSPLPPPQTRTSEQHQQPKGDGCAKRTAAVGSPSQARRRPRWGPKKGSENRTIFGGGGGGGERPELASRTSASLASTSVSSASTTVEHPQTRRTGEAVPSGLAARDTPVSPPRTEGDGEKVARQAAGGGSQIRPSGEDDGEGGGRLPSRSNSFDQRDKGVSGADPKETPEQRRQRLLMECEMHGDLPKRIRERLRKSALKSSDGDASSTLSSSALSTTAPEWGEKAGGGAVTGSKGFAASSNAGAGVAKVVGTSSADESKLTPPPSDSKASMADAAAKPSPALGVISPSSDRSVVSALASDVVDGGAAEVSVTAGDGDEKRETEDAAGVAGAASTSKGGDDARARLAGAGSRRLSLAPVEGPPPPDSSASGQEMANTTGHIVAAVNRSCEEQMSALSSVGANAAADGTADGAGNERLMRRELSERPRESDAILRDGACATPKADDVALDALRTSAGMSSGACSLIESSGAPPSGEVATATASDGSSKVVAHDSDFLPSAKREGGSGEPKRVPGRSGGDGSISVWRAPLAVATASFSNAENPSVDAGRHNELISSEEKEADGSSHIARSCDERVGEEGDKALYKSGAVSDRCLRVARGGAGSISSHEGGNNAEDTPSDSIEQRAGVQMPESEGPREAKRQKSSAAASGPVECDSGQAEVGVAALCRVDVSEKESQWQGKHVQRNTEQSGAIGKTATTRIEGESNLSQLGPRMPQHKWCGQMEQKSEMPASCVKLSVVPEDGCNRLERASTQKRKRDKTRLDNCTTAMDTDPSFTSALASGDEQPKDAATTREEMEDTQDGQRPLGYSTAGSSKEDGCFFANEVKTPPDRVKNGRKKRKVSLHPTKTELGKTGAGNSSVRKPMSGESSSEHDTVASRYKVSQTHPERKKKRLDEEKRTSRPAPSPFNRQSETKLNCQHERANSSSSKKARAEDTALPLNDSVDVLKSTPSNPAVVIPFTRTKSPWFDSFQAPDPFRSRINNCFPPSWTDMSLIWSTAGKWNIETRNRERSRSERLLKDFLRKGIISQGLEHVPLSRPFGTRAGTKGARAEGLCIQERFKEKTLQGRASKVSSEVMLENKSDTEKGKAGPAPFSTCEYSVGGSLDPLLHTNLTKKEVTLAGISDPQSNKHRGVGGENSGSGTMKETQNSSEISNPQLSLDENDSVFKSIQVVDTSTRILGPEDTKCNDVSSPLFCAEGKEEPPKKGEKVALREEEGSGYSESCPPQKAVGETKSDSRSGSGTREDSSSALEPPSFNNVIDVAKQPEPDNLGTLTAVEVNEPGQSGDVIRHAARNASAVGEGQNPSVSVSDETLNSSAVETKNKTRGLSPAQEQEPDRKQRQRRESNGLTHRSQPHSQRNTQLSPAKGQGDAPKGALKCSTADAICLVALENKTGSSREQINVSNESRQDRKGMPNFDDTASENSERARQNPISLKCTANPVLPEIGDVIKRQDTRHLCGNPETQPNGLGLKESNGKEANCMDLSSASDKKFVERKPDGPRDFRAEHPVLPGKGYVAQCNGGSHSISPSATSPVAWPHDDGKVPRKKEQHVSSESPDSCEAKGSNSSEAAGKEIPPISDKKTDVRSHDEPHDLSPKKHLPSTEVVANQSYEENSLDPLSAALNVDQRNKRVSKKEDSSISEDRTDDNVLANSLRKPSCEQTESHQNETQIQASICSAGNIGAFVNTSSGSWICQNCSIISPSLRSAGYESKTKPASLFIKRHAKLCRGAHPDLAILVDAILGMANTVSSMKFETVCADNFKAIVRALVGGQENFVALFTDDVRATWFDKDFKSCTIQVDQWQHFPSEKVDKVGALSAMADFARAGVGFEFVTNKFFVQYVSLVAPGYELPSVRDLIECW